jgi:uncharacterized protein YbaR (Trm112 family)
MAQYIEKSALLAEIDRLVNNYDKALDYEAALEDVLDFIDTLEVKEVDLNEEIELVKGDYEQVDVAWNNDFDYIAKHFFELGLRSTITEEDCKLIWNIGDEIPCMTEEEFFKELLRRYKAHKGEEV